MMHAVLITCLSLIGILLIEPKAKADITVNYTFEVKCSTGWFNTCGTNADLFIDNPVLVYCSHTYTKDDTRNVTYRQETISDRGIHLTVEAGSGVNSAHYDLIVVITAVDRSSSAQYREKAGCPGATPIPRVTRVVCSSNSMPDGWIAIADATTKCSEPTQKRQGWEIMEYSSEAKGSVIEVCSWADLPKGWKSIRVFTGNRCSSSAKDDMRTIEKL